MQAYCFRFYFLSVTVIILGGMVVQRVSLMGPMAFASPAGLRSGTILKFDFEIVNGVLSPSISSLISREPHQLVPGRERVPGVNRDLCRIVPVLPTATHEHADLTINVVHAYLAALRVTISMRSCIGRWGAFVEYANLVPDDDKVGVTLYKGWRLSRQSVAAVFAPRM